MGCVNICKTKGNPVSFKQGLKPPVDQVHQISSLKLTPGIFVLRNNKKFNEVYKVVNSLGQGGFGEVKLCAHRESGIQRAVKIIRKDQIDPDKTETDFRNELEILKTLDHPNIVRIYESFEDDRRFFIVMEHCAGGELFNEICKRRIFSEKECANVMYQLLSAVTYLHERGIVHRDIKPENILIDKKGTSMHIKLIDFGTATFYAEGAQIRGAYGTVYYIAPEVLTGRYNEKCDLWSCGVIMYILLVGQVPFDGQRDTEILENVYKMDIDLSTKNWTKISEQAKDLVEQLMKEANKRPSAREALSHPWLTSFTTVQQSSRFHINTLDNLRNFHSFNKLRDAVQTYITTQIINNRDLEQLRKVFTDMDIDGDGKLSREELIQEYQKNLGVEHAEEVVEQIFKEVDVDGNGYIDYSEFLKATLDVNKVLSQKNVHMSFKLFDKDGSGKISAQELKQILSPGMENAEEVWELIVNEIDQNGDGEIDFDEFKSIVLSKF